MTEMLAAHARVPLTDPAGMLEKLCDHFEPHATLTRTAGGAQLRGRLGLLELRADGAALLLRVSGETDGHVSVLKMAAAEQVFAFAGDAAPRFTWSGHDSGRRDIPYFREMIVAHTRQITPRMRRIILTGDAAHFAAGGLHVRLLVPPAGRAPVWPHAGADGRTVWPAGEDALIPRVYTVREIDASRGQITIDMALHEGPAPGADWARRACPGDKVGLLGPGGAMPQAASWYLFAGDETALPAIARLVADLPREARAVVRIEVADAAEEQDLPSSASLDLAWLHRGSAPAGTTDLLQQAVRTVDWPEDLEGAYAWIGCEQAGARALRTYLAREKGLAKSRQLVAAYWRMGHQGVDIDA